jgi:hypothetical protein
MAGKFLTVANNAVIIGVITAISIAILCIVVLNSLWWILQESYGHAMFHKLEPYVMGAEYMQFLSLLIVMSMSAGALTAYFSKAAPETDKAAAIAGAFSGLAIACTFSICAMVIFLLVSAGMPDAVWYLASNAPLILFISLIVPAVISIPSASVGAIVLRHSMSAAGDRGRRRMSKGSLLAVAVTSIVIVGLIAAAIALYYGIPAIYPLIYSIPLLLTVPIVAAAMRPSHKNWKVPTVIIALALSVTAIVILPLAGTALACQAGLICAEPYEWEHPYIPDVSMIAAQNASYPVEDLARNLSEKCDFDWGMSLFWGYDDEANSGVIEIVNMSSSGLGVITRPLRPDEAALGLDQTIIAIDGAGNGIVFITKGERQTNVTRFIDFALSEEGRMILAGGGYMPA